MTSSFTAATDRVGRSVANWIAACDRVLELDVSVIVPGHGPLAAPSAVADLKSYFELLTTEARLRHDAGMSALEAAQDIDLGPYAGWGEAERVVANIAPCTATSATSRRRT